MFSSSNSNLPSALAKEKQKETARYWKRIRHELPSPFYLACANGDTVYVEGKLKALSSHALDQLEPTGETALHIATRNNHLEIVRLLLQSGCSRNAYNSTHKLPNEEAQTDQMRQLYDRSTSSHFFEESPQDSFGIFKPLEQSGRPTESNATQPEQTVTAGGTTADQKKLIWNQEFQSEEEVMKYLTNRQTLVMWVKIWAWFNRIFGRILSRREGEGNDFAPELFDLDKDRDLEEFFKSLSSNETQRTATAEESPKKDEAGEDDDDEEEKPTWRQRFMTTLCCRNATAPAPQSSQSTTTDSFINVQPKISAPKHAPLRRIHKRLTSMRDPRDFIKASKELNSVTPLIYLYTRSDLPFYAKLNKKLATIDSNPNGAASVCDRFIREFDLRDAELSKFGFSGVTYRGTTMLESDVQNYRKASEQNPKWIIAPKTFLSTSFDRSEAMKHLPKKIKKGHPVGLMVFHIPVACSTIFAVKDISPYPQECEVLFMPGNLFTITKVTQCEGDLTLPEVHLEHVNRNISFLKKLSATYRAATTSASGID